MVMKRVETKTSLPTINNESKKEKKKKKKKNQVDIPLAPKIDKSVDNNKNTNMIKIENNLFNSTAVDSDFSKRDTDLSDLRSIEQTTIRGSSKGSSWGSNRPTYKLN